MPRLTLDISRNQHQQLKTLSSYAGMSMKEFILTRIFTKAHESIFKPKDKAEAGAKELARLQKNIFKQAEVIVISESGWAELKSKLSPEQENLK